MSRWILASALLAAWVAPTVGAQDKTIDERFAEMQEKYEKRITALESEVHALRRDGQASHRDHDHDIEHAIAQVPPPRGVGAAPHFHFGHPDHSPLDISLDILMTAGTSSEREAQINTLEGGGHDPKKRGFTLNQAELRFAGQVAPCFTGDVSVVYFISPDGETEVELEEAYVSTTCLPRGMHLEMGQFFTEFGRINQKHPHEWDFVDQPVVNTRMFGPDGMRGPGMRLGWLTPLPWFCDVHIGLQNANGETMTSFFSSEEAWEDFSIGGRPFVEQDVRNLGDLVSYLRVDNGFELGPCTTMRIGTSALFGPNATGPDGATWIVGGDLVVTWRPHGRSRGWPFLSSQTEVMYRHYLADNYFDAGDPMDPTDDLAIPGDVLEDWGLYSQLLYGFEPRWVAGIRYEYASGSGGDVDPTTGTPVPRGDDPFRDDRHRFAALLTFMPTDHSRLRLQYNFDIAQHLGHNAHSIWFGVEFLFGKHAAHRY